MHNQVYQIVFEITYKCDLNCHFCYNVWKGRKIRNSKEMTIDQYRKLVSKLPKAHIYGISGGEPLLRNDLPEIIDIFQEKCNIVTIMTSGIHLNKTIISQMKQQKIRIQIPIHGLKEKHDNIVGKSGTFNRLIEVIALLRRENSLFSTSTVVHKGNIAQLKEILEFCISIGSRYLLLIRFLPGGAGLNEGHLMLTKEEVKKSYDILDQVCKKYSVRGGVGVPNLPCIIDESPYRHIDFSSCGAGRDWFVISPSGDFRICNHSPTVHGNLLSQSLNEIIETLEIQQFTEGLVYPHECKNCMMVSKCRGGCRAVAETYYRSVFAPDPLLIANRFPY